MEPIYGSRVPLSLLWQEESCSCPISGPFRDIEISMLQWVGLSTLFPAVPPLLGLVSSSGFPTEGAVPPPGHAPITRSAGTAPLLLTSLKPGFYTLHSYACPTSPLSTWTLNPQNPVGIPNPLKSSGISDKSYGPPPASPPQ